MLKKKLVPILSSLVLVAAIPLGTEAAVTKKNVVANYNNIKVQYNGSLVPSSADTEPFIINGTTYIPLRMMANVFNKNVAWDGSTYTINVSDKASSREAALEAEIASLKSQIATKDARISDLEDEVAELEDDDDSSDDDIEDIIADIEDDLNSDFDDWDGVELTFTLDGDENDVDVEIEIDLEEYEDENGELEDSDVEDLVIEVIEDYIWDDSDLDEADVTGEIIDTSDDDDTLYEFEGNVDDEEILLDDEVIN